jgi:hypothetical protein
MDQPVHAIVLLHVSVPCDPLVSSISSISTIADQCAGTYTTAPLYTQSLYIHLYIITKSNVDQNVSSQCRMRGVLQFHLQPNCSATPLLLHTATSATFLFPVGITTFPTSRSSVNSWSSAGFCYSAVRWRPLLCVDTVTVGDSSFGTQLQAI